MALGVTIKVSADTDQAEAGLKRVGAAVNKAETATSGATAKTKLFSGSMASLGNVSSQTRSRIQNTSFQLQDIIVQLQSGTRASVALSQQLPQLAGGFGAVGAAIGVGLALGIPAVSMAMTALRSESVDLEKNLEDLTEAVSNYKNMSELARSSTDELSQKFGTASAEAAALGAFLSEWAEIEAVERLDNQVTALTESYGGLSRTALQAMDTTDGFFASLFDKNPVGLVTEIENTFLKLQEQLGLTDEQARAVVLSLEQMANASGVDQTIEAAVNLNEEFLRVFGSAKNIPPELREIARQAGITALKASEMTAETEASVEQTKLLKQGLSLAAIEALKLAGIDIASPISTAAKEAAELAAQYGLAYDRALALVTLGGPQGGRGGDPRQFDSRPGFRKQLEDQDNWTLPVPRGGGGGRRRSSGGGGGAAMRDPAIEALINSLKTEDEVLQEWREEGLTTLAEANAKELEVLGGHAEAKLRLEEEYQRRLSDMRGGYHGDGLAQAQTFFGEMAMAMQGGSEKMLRIAKVFGAAESLVNSYRAYTAVLADPSLPWFARVPAAVSVLSAGLGMVSAIKGVSAGGGTGGGAAAASAGAQAAPMTQNVQIDLIGATAAQVDQYQQFADTLNEAARQGLLTQITVAG